MTEVERDAALHQALRRISYLIDLHPEDGTPEDQELDILVPLVVALESLLYPIDGQLTID